MQIRLPFILLLITAISWSACRELNNLDELELSGYDAEYAIPLLRATTTLQDLFEEDNTASHLEIDPDGLLRFFYRGNVTSRSSQDIFKSISRSIPPLIPVGDTVMALPISSPDGLEIDFIDLKTGTLTYGFQSMHFAPVTVTVSIPQLIKDGKPLEMVHELPFRGIIPVNLPAPVSLNLAGYRLVPAADGQIYIKYDLRLPDGKRDTLNNFVMALGNIAFAYAEGYLGNQLLDTDRDTVDIDFFKNRTKGSVTFLDPIVRVQVSNSFGIPTRSNIRVMNILTVNGESLPMKSPYIQTGFDFEYPDFTEVGQTKTTNFIFNKDNSNLVEIISAGPQALDYDVDAFTNPDGDRGIRGYMTDSSKISVQLEVELPLTGYATQFAVRDTFEVQLDGYENVRAAEFKLVAENELPLAADVQAYFYDGNGLLIDSLLDRRTRLLAASQVNTDGNTVSPSRQENLVPVDELTFGRLRNARKLVLLSEFTTSSEGKVPVRLTSGQALTIQLGAKVSVKN